MRICLPRRASGRALCLGVIAAGASAAMLAMGPAGAATDVAVGTISGSGTISPGLTATPTYQSFTFSGSGSIQDPSDPAGSGLYSCSVSGNSFAAETWVHGGGTFSGSCSGPLSIVITGGTYVRAGASLTADGDVTLSNRSKGHFEANCVFLPGQTPPLRVWTYSIACSIAFEGVI